MSPKDVPKVPCPKCQGYSSKVKDSRADPRGYRRTRQCASCGYRFVTMERVEGQRAS